MSSPESICTRRASAAAFPIERPMLYAGSMVRAILRDVDPKTQTRRPVNRLTGFGPIAEFGPSDTPGYDWHFRDHAMRWHQISHARLLECCPDGQAGDHLWIREAHAFSVCDPEGRHWSEEPENWDVIYRADSQQPNGGWRDAEGNVIEAPWRPSIHMPRWASRITLEITGMSVERLQDISETDARAEGARECDPISGREVLLASASQRGSFVLHFRDIWEQINGLDSWTINPWVWVVEFKRIKP